MRGAVLQAATKVSVVLAEEQDLVRAGLAALLEASGRYSVVGHCADGYAVLEMIHSLKPSIAVLDLELPKLHTMAVLSKLRGAGLSVSLVVMSSRRDRKTVLAVLRCGANAYVLKSGPPRHLFEALEQTRNGGIYISPLLEIDKIFVSGNTTGEADPLSLLSTREYQVFSLLVEGIRAKEIAARLDLSPKTVDTYRASLMKKLDIHDVAGLVKYALRRNLIPSA